MRPALTVAVCLLMVISLSAQHINGFHLSADQKIPESSDLDALVETNASWVAISPQALASSMIPRMEWNTDWQAPGNTSQGAIKMISNAKAHDFKVMLMPKLKMEDGSRVADLEMLSERDWEIWWKDYEKFILQQAFIADSLEVEIFCVGSAMTSTLERFAPQWSELIDSIRSVYHERVVYAADWRSFEQVPFWSDLDYIGVNGYFPCDTAKVPRVEEVSVCLNQKASALKALSEQYDKKILFTEFGFRSIFHAASDQEKLISVRSNFFKDKSELSQVNAYRAFFKSFWTKPFIAGGLIWRWHPDYELFLTKGNDYSPQGKGAVNVISEWFKLE